MSQIIGRGAEAILKKQGNELIKERIKKGYRIPELDEKLRKQRTRSEAKLIAKANEIIASPKLISVDEKSKEIKMKYIEGKKLSDWLDKFPEKQTLEICKEIGKNIALIHNKDIIHGDLTTSNMILNKQVYFFDFGLGFHSARIEDKAVDLHLLRQAFESKHFKNWQKYFNAALEGYKIADKYKEIIDRLKKVEARGRYRKKQ
ncbi:Kae1-associated serine/threonine protein kinase [Candidatus Pacearchaeota archaeon]|nr:Kae1-associated serine/threonine protein kinase [Candidatus Pacearchaeota archaeon]